MSNKHKIILFTAVFLVSFLIQMLVPFLSPLKDFLYLVPIIAFLIMFLVYNHFALVKMKSIPVICQ